MSVLLCAARDTKVYYQCRGAPSSTGSDFQINECAVEQAIRIRLAMVGFAPRCPHDHSPSPRHPMKCLRITGRSGGLCNEKTACSIPQKVFDVLDHGHNHRKFILVIYDCVNSGKSIRWFIRNTQCRIVFNMLVVDSQIAKYKINDNNRNSKYN